MFSPSCVNTVPICLPRRAFAACIASSRSQRFWDAASSSDRVRLMNTPPLHSLNGSRNRERAEKQARHDSAEERADDGNRRITPIGRAFAGDRENGVRNARTKIASRINGISRRAAQRQADAPDEAANEVGAEPRCGSARRYLLGENCANDEDENKRGDDFTEQ